MNLRPYVCRYYLISPQALSLSVSNNTIFMNCCITASELVCIAHAIRFLHIKLDKEVSHSTAQHPCNLFFRYNSRQCSTLRPILRDPLVSICLTSKHIPGQGRYGTLFVKDRWKGMPTEAGLEEGNWTLFVDPKVGMCHSLVQIGQAVQRELQAKHICNLRWPCCAIGDTWLIFAMLPLSLLPVNETR